MAGYRNAALETDGPTGGPVRQNLRAARAYGCLFATMLGAGMSFVVFLGNVMGDCEPGPGCHDHDGVHIARDLAVALPIAAVLGAGMWLLAAAVRAALQPVIGERAVILLLVALTLALVWFSFNPAFEAFFRWTAPFKT